MTPLITFLWVINVCFDTLGQMAFKYAAIHPNNSQGWRYWYDLFSRKWLWAGISAYLLAFLLWLAFLSLVPLSQAILLGSVNMITVMLAGRILFKEHLTPFRLLGIIFIILGVVIVGAF